MSNEYTEWLKDIMEETAIENKLMDKVTNISIRNELVSGICNGEPVTYHIWMGEDGWEWRKI